MSENGRMARREFLLRTIGLVAAVQVVEMLAPMSARANALPTVTVYKDPQCGCCKKWVEHLRTSGFTVDAKDRTDMDALKDSLGVPQELRSCHTAVIGKYFIEGHVPAADVKQMLSQKPAGLRGLAVPGMPAGSPGMESGTLDKYAVIALGTDGKTAVFARHG